MYLSNNESLLELYEEIYEIEDSSNDNNTDASNSVQLNSEISIGKQEDPKRSSISLGLSSDCNNLKDEEKSLNSQKPRASRSSIKY